MTDQGKLDTLNKLIENDRGSIKWNLISAISLFVIGLVISSLIYYLSQPETIAQNHDQLTKYLLGIPALVTTLLSSFPIKEYFTKKNRIVALEYIGVAFKTPPVNEEIGKRFEKILDSSLT